MQAEFRTGIPTTPLGSDLLVPPALGAFRQQLVSDFLPPYSDLVSRGYVYSVGTAVAGVAPGTVISTTPPIALYNPPGSGYKLVLLKARCSIISGTLGVGTIFLQQCAQPAPPTTGAGLTLIVNARLGSGIQDAVAKAYQGSTVAATPTIVAPLFQVIATQVIPVEAVINGEFEVLPGNAASLQATAAAGTSPIVAFSMTWAEISI